MKTLNISMRPKCLDEIIGQDEMVNSVKNQFKSGRIPHFFLISGPTGSGKTTLARIIALMLQNKDHVIKEYNMSKYDIREINASDKNGVDDIRELINTFKYKPISPSISRVIIMDEAHQLTTQAQNALLKDTEDAPDHLYFIFSTNLDSKLLPTLKRRAFQINTTIISGSSIKKLVEKAAGVAGFQGDLSGLITTLDDNEINSPGLILQAAERYFSGVNVEESTNTVVDTKKLCNYISKGDWKNASVILSLINKEDVVGIRFCLLGYLKTILLNSGSLEIAKAMDLISETTYELPIFLAKLRIMCEIIKNK